MAAEIILDLRRHASYDAYRYGCRLKVEAVFL